MIRLWQDVQYALRQLRNAPMFAVTAIVTLALGIGANTAMFSVVDQVLLRSMPFPDANRLVQISGRSASGSFSPTSLPDARDYASQSHSFQSMAFYSEQIPTLGGRDGSRLVPEILGSSNLLSTLGVEPMMGRGIGPADTASGAKVLLLSASLWHGTYASDPHILGRTIPVNGEPYTVIGVMPEGFAFPVNEGEGVIWAALPVNDPGMQDRGNAGLVLIGRLRSGVRLSAAKTEINAIHARLLHAYPKDETAGAIDVVRYADVVTGSVRPALLALDGAVIAVWLIACANVAGLMLARGNARRREIAVRAALGAGRGRIVRQFLTESLVIGLAAGALGLEVAHGSLQLLQRYLAQALPYGETVHIDAKVCGYLIAASCLSAILFGLAPALHASRVAPQDGLRQGTAAGGTSRQQARWRDALVVGEIALTLSLLVAAGFMLRTLETLRHTPTGFVADEVTTAQMFLPGPGFFATGPKPASGPSCVQTFYTPLLQQVRAWPGVRSAGFTTVRPLEGNWDFNMTVDIQGRPKPRHAAEADAQARATSTGYFRAMGIALLRGRDFEPADAASAPVAVVNDAFARTFFPHQDPLGHLVRMNDKGDRQWSRIIGVVADSPQKTIAQRPLPEINYDLEQMQPTDDLYPILGAFMSNIAIRSPLGAAPVERNLRQAMHAIEPLAALNEVKSMQEVVDESLGNQVLAARLLSLFAVVGLVIALAGIYGLLAYSVSQRTRELALRFALGAQRQQVVWLILRHAVVLLAVGVGLGGAIALASGRWMAGYLDLHLRSEDALVAFAVAGLLAAFGLAASYLPAYRASLVEPATALRAE